MGTLLSAASKLTTRAAGLSLTNGGPSLPALTSVPVTLTLTLLLLLALQGAFCAGQPADVHQAVPGLPEPQSEDRAAAQPQRPHRPQGHKGLLTPQPGPLHPERCSKLLYDLQTLAVEVFFSQGGGQRGL